MHTRLDGRLFLIQKSQIRLPTYSIFLPFFVSDSVCQFSVNSRTHVLTSLKPAIMRGIAGDGSPAGGGKSAMVWTAGADRSRQYISAWLASNWYLPGFAFSLAM